MRPPVITATYLAVLALIYTALSLRVVGLRRGNRIAFDDGENRSLRSAIRAHAHFAEYVPMIILMIGALEMLGTSAVQLHMLLGRSSYPGSCIPSVCTRSPAPRSST